MKTIVMLIAAVIAEATFFALHGLRGSVPSLVVAILVAVVTRETPAQAALFGAFAGFLEDALCGTGLCWAIATAGTAATCSWLARSVVVESTLIYAVVAALASGIRDGAFWIMQTLAGAPSGLEYTHLRMTLWRMLGTAILTAIIVSLRERYMLARAR